MRRPRRLPPAASRNAFPADGHTVLVVGDVMLDQFVIGWVARISPEAPVPVVRFDRKEYRLGGAANVAANLQALGARVEMVGLVGTTTRGGGCGELSAPASAPRAGRRTPSVHDAQDARGDEPQPAGGADRLRGGPRGGWRERRRRWSRGSRSWRPRGRHTRLRLSERGRLARGRGSGDRRGRAPRDSGDGGPQGAAHLLLPGATLLTPTTTRRKRWRTCGRGATPRSRPARRVGELTGCANVLITRGEHGMWLHTPGGTRRSRRRRARSPTSPAPAIR